MVDYAAQPPPTKPTQGSIVSVPFGNGEFIQGVQGSNINIEGKKVVEDTPPPANHDTHTIKQLITNGNLKEALALLPDTDNFTLLKSRFSENEKAKYLGIISHENYTLEKNHITAALLDLMGE